MPIGFTSSGLPLIKGGKVVLGAGEGCNTTCCQFTHCTEPVTRTFLCASVDPPLEEGEIVKIDGQCYTYDGVVECEGEESSVEYLARYEDCEDENCDAEEPDRCPTSSEYPQTPNAIISGVDGPFDVATPISCPFGATVTCEDCDTVNGSYEFSSPSGTNIGSWVGIDLSSCMASDWELSLTWNCFTSSGVRKIAFTLTAYILCVKAVYAEIVVDAKNFYDPVADEYSFAGFSTVVPNVFTSTVKQCTVFGTTTFIF